MKRIMIASALALSMAGATHAATPAERTQIESYLPSVDVTTWSDTEVATAMTVINSSDSRSTKVGKLQALFTGDTYAAPMPDLTDAERQMLMEAAPGADLDTVPQARLDAALVAMSSGTSAAERQSRVQQLLSMDETAVSGGNSATAGEVAILTDFLPEVDVSALSETQVTTALAIIYSAENRQAAQDELEALFVY